MPQSRSGSSPRTKAKRLKTQIAYLPPSNVKRVQKKVSIQSPRMRRSPKPKAARGHR